MQGVHLADAKVIRFLARAALLASGILLIVAQCAWAADSLKEQQSNVPGAGVVVASSEPADTLHLLLIPGDSLSPPRSSRAGEQTDFELQQLRTVGREVIASFELPEDAQLDRPLLLEFPNHWPAESVLLDEHPLPIKTGFTADSTATWRYCYERFSIQVQLPPGSVQGVSTLRIVRPGWPRELLEAGLLSRMQALKTHAELMPSQVPPSGGKALELWRQIDTTPEGRRSAIKLAHLVESRWLLIAEGFARSASPDSLRFPAYLDLMGISARFGTVETTDGEKLLHEVMQTWDTGPLHYQLELSDPMAVQFQDSLRGGELLRFTHPMKRQEASHWQSDLKGTMTITSPLQRIRIPLSSSSLPFIESCGQSAPPSPEKPADINSN